MPKTLSNSGLLPSFHGIVNDPPEPDKDLDAAVEALAASLASDVVERDRAGKPPFEEVERLRESGLLLLPLPAEYGGPGASLTTIYSVVRRIARVDPSIATLLGYHYQRVRGIAFVEDPGKRAWLAGETLEHNWYLGGTGSAQEDDLELRRIDGGYLLNGRKNFSTGAIVADRIYGGGRLPDDDKTKLRILIDPQRDDGTVKHLPWDNLGERLSASGPIEFSDYVVADADVIGTWPADINDFPAHRTLGVPGFQLTFVNLYVGIAEGVLLAARGYTREHGRPWLHSVAEQATEDPYVLSQYGDLVAQVQAASALKDQAVAALEWALSRGEDLTKQERGEVAALIVSAKVVSTQGALEATAQIFDVTGGRATQLKFGLDRFWRDVRTHSLHDPVAYKQEELGRFFLNDQIVEPSPYR
jgi:alkylation response protein AidB-like acyl-CoA dehydrogenase